MADIQLYTAPKSDEYSDWQVAELKKPLDPRLISERRGAGGRKLKYLQGHTAIDQANRIFGHGNWGYRTLSCEQVVLIDPLTGEAVGIEYKAFVELTVRGAIAPVTDIGSQPVAAWNVEDQIMGRRVNDAKATKTKVNEDPFTPLEKKDARAVITEAHEQAKKGAVTDALKRALRAYGDAFGNGLYGDGHVDIQSSTITEENTVDSRTSHQNGNLSANGNHPALPAKKTVEAAPPAPAQSDKDLLNLIARAKSRAITLDQVHNATEWQALLEHLHLTDLKTVADVGKVNAYLTEVEQKKAAVTSGK